MTGPSLNFFKINIFSGNEKETMVRELWERSSVLLLLEYIILRLSMSTRSLAPTHDHLFTGSRKSTTNVIIENSIGYVQIIELFILYVLIPKLSVEIFLFQFQTALLKMPIKFHSFYFPLLFLQIIIQTNTRIEKYFLILFNLFKNKLSSP